MLCSNPFVRTAEPKGKALSLAQQGKQLAPRVFPCGQCTNCRINRSRNWTHRILLEMLDHADNSFVTLTYNNFFLPNNFNLFPRDVTLFFKRLRSNTGRDLRYYYCGEYGELSGRPHYHLALFGLGQQHKTDIEKAWTYKSYPLGNVFIGDLNKNSARYISGYIMKGATKTNEFTEKILKGRLPEFQRMSRNPGLGVNTIKRIGQKSNGKVQRIKQISVGANKFFLGRTLQTAMDECLNFDDDGNQFNDYCNELYAEFYTEETGYRDDIISGNSQRRKQQQKRYSIFNRKRGV